MMHLLVVAAFLLSTTSCKDDAPPPPKTPVATSSGDTLPSQTKRDIEEDVFRGLEVGKALISKDLLLLLKSIEELAQEPELVSAVAAGKRGDPSKAERVLKKNHASLGFDFASPELMALTDAEGKVLALMARQDLVANPVPDYFFEDGKHKHAALRSALNEGASVTEFARLGEAGILVVSTAPLVDPETDSVAGAVVVGFRLPYASADILQQLVGAHVAFFHGEEVYDTSFNDKGVAHKLALTQLLKKHTLAKDALESSKGLSDIVAVNFEGVDYIASAARLTRYSSKALPKDYPGPHAGFLVLKALPSAK